LRSVLLAIAVSMLAASSFLGSLGKVRPLKSTVPGNGDVNPYGVAVVANESGGLLPNHVLISNFNNSNNLQGTGTTIVQFSPGGGEQKLFAQIDAATLPGPCPGGVGLTTALAVLRSGWVIVGSLPTSDGMAATAQAGCLLVLDNKGHVAATLSGGAINGPWDMTAVDHGNTAVLFVTNVLNGTVAANGSTVSGGTVLRIVLSVPQHGQGVPTETSRTIIGDGFPEKTDPAALVIGPTGVGLNSEDTLFVADTLANRIAAIPNASTRTTSAGTGTTVSGGGALNGPLGLLIAPNGNILTTNAGDGNMVETTPAGVQAFVKGVDLTGAGAGTLFGLALRPEEQGVYFVNDGNNTLNLLQH
jgi:hypothetical protein